MSRLLRKWSFSGSASLLTFFFSSAALADVDLEWRPASAIMDVGEQVRLGLYAVSTTGGDQPILAVEVILEWDPVSVEFLGFVNDGPYEWLSSELPDDSMLDGLNDSLTDGDAYYRAFAQFGNPAVATPEGLLVASFDFGALLPDADTTVAILASAGSYTETAVWDAESANHNIVGTLGTAHLTIHGCVDDSECSDGNECTQDVCDAGVCTNPPEPTGTSCGDPADDDCTNPDTCDGAGACLDNHEPDGTACPDELFCNGEETCDGAGTCQPGTDPCVGAWFVCDEDTDECVCAEHGNLDDFAEFVTCFTGPGSTPPGGCGCPDSDADGDVDLADFAAFQVAFTGEP